jgi:hypothetical protein
MSINKDLLELCNHALHKIDNGSFNPRRDSLPFLNFYKTADANYQSYLLLECQKILDATALTLYQKGSSRIMDPKLTQYYGQKLIPFQCLRQRDYFRYFIQIFYDIFAGRLLTPLGGIRLYFTTSFLLILLYAIIYRFLGLEWTNVCTIHDVSFIDTIYFSGITLTTLGYGDIHPVSEIGRIVATSQALLGYLLLGLGVYGVSSFLTPFRPNPQQINLNEYILKLQELIKTEQ